MFGSFLPSLWSLSNQSLLGSRSRHSYAITNSFFGLDGYTSGMEHHPDVDLTESSFDEFVSFLFDRDIPPGPGCLLGSGFDKKRARKWLAGMLVFVGGGFPGA